MGWWRGNKRGRAEEGSAYLGSMGGGGGGGEVSRGQGGFFFLSREGLTKVFLMDLLDHMGYIQVWGHLISFSPPSQGQPPIGATLRVWQV